MHTTFTGAPFQDAHANRRASCIHQTTHSIAPPGMQYDSKQAAVHSQSLPNAMCVSSPLPRYILLNLAGARGHHATPQGHARAAAPWSCSRALRMHAAFGMPGCFKVATSTTPRQSRTHTHTHTHTHTRARTRTHAQPLRAHPLAHTHAQLPHGHPPRHAISSI